MTLTQSQDNREKSERQFKEENAFFDDFFNIWGHNEEPACYQKHAILVIINNSKLNKNL